MRKNRPVARQKQIGLGPGAFFSPPALGFTLVEILIVTAIIGILAAVAIPQYVKYIKRTRTSEGIQHCRKLFNAVVDWHTSPNYGNGVFPANPQAEGANGITFARAFPTETSWWDKGDVYYTYAVSSTQGAAQGTSAIVTALAKGGSADPRVFAVEIVTDVGRGPVITRTSINF